jgi:hypothetical protein
MSDTSTQCADLTLDMLRERERELEIEARIIAGRLTELRELIATLTSRRPRAPRKPRMVVAGVELHDDPAAPRDAA